MNKLSKLLSTTLLIFNPFIAKSATLSPIFIFTTSTGEIPSGDLTLDAAGNLYGVTSWGGNGLKGTLFKLDPAGSLITLKSFTVSVGAHPRGGIVLDANGSFYGATTFGGPEIGGGIYKLSSSNVLTNLDSHGDFGRSNSGFSIDKYGNKYVATGSNILKIDQFDHIAKLSSTVGGYSIGQTGRLYHDNIGNIFGTTLSGGLFGFGSVFKVGADGIFSDVISFDSANGAFSSSGVVGDRFGNLFGTTAYGGVNDLGTVFKVDSSGSLTTLFSFDGANGERPRAGLVQDATGALFGVASSGGAFGGGTVFKIDSSGVFELLASFDRISGSGPEYALTADSAGDLYGVTPSGGAYGFRNFQTGTGTVFKVSGAGFVTSVTSIPEPASWAMLIVGFSMIGAVGRRSRMSFGLKQQTL